MRNILVIDDEESIILITTRVLTKSGFNVEKAANGLEGIKKFDEGTFDLVITDMTMPNMTGMDLTKQLMNIRHDIPIILCTGFSELINENKAKDMGISAFAMKPLAMNEIAVTIREVLDKK